MNRTWVVVTVIAASLGAGCGQGRVIFNVDVYSFLKTANRDTVPYYAPLPPGVPDTIPVQTVNLLPTGAGSSIVDSASLTGLIAFVDAQGTGSVTYQLYIDTARAVYTRPALLTVSSGSVSPGDSVNTPVSLNIPAAIKPFFTSTKVYIGARVASTATSPPVQGRARLTALQLSVALQDKIF